MNRPQSPSAEPIETLRDIVARDQVWPHMAAKHGVSNPLPPWKSSLDALCDVLDRSACDAQIPNFSARRDEEDELSATTYAALPYPENQLVALAHSLMTHGVIDEQELRERIVLVRERLER
ncbi:thiocyanate hydrolase [Rhodococcus sp. P1Y]|nr:thiocyanate hydrolase [Rhodococcus sp. P1Y]